jgi:hypothetical protein
LRELVLEDNRIGDEGAAAVAAALGGCSSSSGSFSSGGRERRERRQGGGCPACHPRPSFLAAAGKERRRGLEV